MRTHRNNLKKTKVTPLLSFWTLPQCLCLWNKSWTVHLKFIIAYLEVIWDYAWMEQKVCSSSLPGLLRLAYLIERDYMQCFYSPKLNFITLMQSEDNYKGKSNLHGQLPRHTLPHPQIVMKGLSLQWTAASRSWDQSWNAHGVGIFLRENEISNPKVLFLTLPCLFLF